MDRGQAHGEMAWVLVAATVAMGLATVILLFADRIGLLSALGPRAVDTAPVGPPPVPMIVVVLLAVIVGGVGISIASALKNDKSGSSGEP